jgi:hypothetical protein
VNVGEGILLEAPRYHRVNGRVVANVLPKSVRNAPLRTADTINVT